MRDREFNELMHGYLDGELDESVLREFRAEIEANPERRARLDAEERFVDRVRLALRPRPVAADYRESIRALVRGSAPTEAVETRDATKHPPVLVRVVRSRVVQTFAAAAAALVLIVVGHSIVTSTREGRLLPDVIRDSVDLFDATVIGAEPVDEVDYANVEDKAHYPSPPFIEGSFDFRGFANNGTTFQGLPNPCFIYRGEQGSEIAFFCLGGRMRDSDFIENLGRSFRYKGYNVVVCGVPGSVHIWVTKLPLDDLKRVIEKDYGPSQPAQGVEVPVSNLCCCGCADRALKALAGLEEVFDARASVTDRKIYVQARSGTEDLRKKIVVTLASVGFDAK